LGRGVLIALQGRTDATLRIRTVQVGKRSLPVETRIPLSYLNSGDGLCEWARLARLQRQDGSAFCQLPEDS
jgi:L-arabinokinase